MDLETVWTIAAKDLSVVRRKRSIFYALVLFPLFVSIGLPGVIWLVEHRNTIPDDVLTNLMNAFTFFFVIVATVIPTGISAYSIVGEKVEKSLEPLLATPARDSEILLGKSLASFLPTIVAIYGGSALFMVLMDALTYGQLGYLYFPNWTAAVILLLVVPLTIIYAVELNVLVSSRVNDIRTANSLGSLAFSSSLTWLCSTYAGSPSAERRYSQSGSEAHHTAFLMALRTGLPTQEALRGRFELPRYGVPPALKAGALNRAWLPQQWMTACIDVQRNMSISQNRSFSLMISSLEEKATSLRPSRSRPLDT
jgi:ABC-2 type transport system permease protein